MTNGEQRRQIRELVKEELEGKSSVVLPELTNSVVGKVMGDSDLLAAVVEETLRPYIYTVATQAMAATRQPVTLGDELMSREEFDKKTSVLSKRFERWMEHANGRYVQFMEMDKSDLEEAARQREARAGTELAIARFERMLAGKLRKKDKVSDQFTPEQLDELWDKANGDERAA